LKKLQLNFTVLIQMFMEVESSSITHIEVQAT